MSSTTRRLRRAAQRDAALRGARAMGCSCKPWIRPGRHDGETASRTSPVAHDDDCPLRQAPSTLGRLPRAGMRPVTPLEVLHMASIEVIARLRAADLAQLDGYRDIADRLRTTAARWAELERGEMLVDSPIGEVLPNELGRPVHRVCPP